MTFTVRRLAFTALLALMWPAVPSQAACTCTEVAPPISAAIAARRWNEAERLLAAAVAASDEREAHLCRASLLLEKGRTAPAQLDPALADAVLTGLEGVNARWPSDPVAHTCTLDVVQARGDHVAFLQALRRAAEGLQPLGMEFAVETLLHYPTKYFNENELGEASDALLTLLDVYPGSVELHSSLGVLLLEKGEIAAASERFARALELDPHDVLVLERSTGAALYRQDFAAARRFAELALREDPSSTTRYFDLAAIALHEGATAGLPAWKRYLDQHARVPDEEPWPRIAEDVVARLERKSTSRDLDQIAQDLIRANAPGLAIAVLAGAAEREPGDPVHLFLLGTAYERGKLLALALEQLLRAQRLVEEDLLLEVPSRPSVAYEVGRVALALEQMDLALRNLEYAARENPAHGDTHYALALAYTRSGQDERAREEFQLCLWAERPSSQRELCRRGATEPAPAAPTTGGD
jgi:tetratricopeptide (TPR) repeat protein